MSTYFLLNELCSGCVFNIFLCKKNLTVSEEFFKKISDTWDLTVDEIMICG